MKICGLGPRLQVGLNSSVVPSYKSVRKYASAVKKPVTVSWTQMKDAPRKMSAHGADLIQNRVQVWMHQSWLTAFRTLSYDFENDEWSSEKKVEGTGPVSSKDSARIFAFHCGDKTILIGKSHRAGFNLTAPFRPVDRTFIFDPQKLSCRLAPKHSFALQSYSPVRVDHPTRPLWIVGDDYFSYGDKKSPLQLMYFDVQTEKWTRQSEFQTIKVENSKEAPVPESHRKEIMTGSLGPKIYTFHQKDGEPEVHMFDTESNHWHKIKATGKTAMGGSYLAGGSTVTLGNLIFLTGVYNMNGMIRNPTGDLYCFDTKNNDWRTVKVMGETPKLTLSTLTRIKDNEAVLIGGMANNADDSVHKLKVVDQ